VQCIHSLISKRGPRGLKYIAFVCLGLALVLGACSQGDSSSDSSPTITTVAGAGTAGYSGDGGAATSATLDYPRGVALDSSGNLYIADYNSSVVRKVDASTGYISTVAGNGTAGYSGDDGLATEAKLKYPWGVAVDSSGNLYIADTGNARVRKVDASTNYISTVAGNGSLGTSGDGAAATSAKLYGPSSVAVDSSGNLYIADPNTYRVRKVTASTGYISTVAGTANQGYAGDGGLATSAILYGPQSVAVDSSGNLYIADTGNFVVRKVDASTGKISTVAGNHAQGQGNSGDGGAATSAKLCPYGLALDSSGNIYIADSVYNVIRKVEASTNYISTVAGNGTAGFSGDGGTPSSAELNAPCGVALDSSGNLYIADYKNYRVRKVTQ
jgi:trimeric autotransporter adhesin